MVSFYKEKINNENIIYFFEGENKFKIMMGGADLFWVQDDYNKENSFIVDKKDKYWFSIFDLLFKKIKSNDNKYNPTINENVFEWVSEAYGTFEEANKLQIIKQKKQYIIKFIKNINNPFKKCAVCFCNFGSNYPLIAQLFMIMYLRFCEINNNCPEVDCEKVLSFKPLI